MTFCWDKIWADVEKFQLQEGPDVITLRLDKNQRFSVKSLYNGLTKNDACPFFK